MDVLAALKRYFGYDAFRPVQEEVVRSLLAGQDVAAVMPTGGGKSLCYQLPAAMMEGTAVVVSPLIALMQDQVAQLAEAGIAAAGLNSAMEAAEQRRVMAEARAGRYKLLYLSPERLLREGMFDWLERVAVSFFVVDEAHCISEWGHEFRPEYRRLRELRPRFSQPVAAFTASATKKVRQDILEQLGLRSPKTFIRSFFRPNLRYIVRECDAKTQEKLLLATLNAHQRESAIVYAPTITMVEETEAWLKRKGIAALAYHGRMDTDKRARHQELWMAGEAHVLVGTIAFGMGINKPEVRAVVHLSLPKSLEQYYQEAGRAGRDGEPADCVLLWRRADAGLLAHFIQQIDGRAERSRAWERYRVMRKFVEGAACRHRTLCLHFGETPKWTNCGQCDACGNTAEYLELPVRRPAPAAVAAREEDADVLSALRQWRKEEAAARGVPAFVVMHDSVLRALSRMRPRSEGELLEVPGIGAKKAAQYGRALLRFTGRAWSGS